MKQIVITGAVCAAFSVAANLLVDAIRRRKFDTNIAIRDMQADLMNLYDNDARIEYSIDKLTQIINSDNLF